MKIGILTFHWATNYGAVLQAYALQQYLALHGYDVEIIDYVPLRVKRMETISNIRQLAIRKFIQEQRLSQFRKQHLRLSARTYHSHSELLKYCQSYDVNICGSDQIWNEWFALLAEGRPTLSYYLDYVDTRNTRVSYAASFGTERLSSDVCRLVRPQLEKFRHISVRENTGKAIVEEMGLHAELVVDPSLLLQRDSYQELIDGIETKGQPGLFTYILHRDQATAHLISDHVQSRFFGEHRNCNCAQEPIGIFEWLHGVAQSRFVVTNSFHGLALSLIYHKPFIVVPVERSGMNDRIVTLLEALGLKDHMISHFDPHLIDGVVNNPCDWTAVDQRVAELRRRSTEFIDKALRG